MEDSDISEGSGEENGEGEHELDPDNPEHYFPILERGFNQTLAIMERSPEAAQFVDMFNKLFEAFYKAYSAEKDLEEKTENMQNEINEKNEGLESAAQQSDVDKKTIDDLNGQIQHAWKLADTAHLREQLAQEIIDNLRRQVENLNAEIDFRNKMSSDADETGESAKHKEGLERERERLISEINQLNLKLQNALSYQDELERKASEADLKINEYAGLLEDQTGETNRLKRNKEKLEEDILQLKYKLEGKDTELVELNTVIETQLKQNRRLELDIKDAKNAYDKVAKDLELSSVKLTKLQGEYNGVLFDIDNIKKILQEKARDQKMYHDEIVHYKNEVSKYIKIREGLEKKVVLLIQEKTDISSNRGILRHRIATMEREIDDLKLLIDENKRLAESIHKEKDNLNKQLQRQQAVQADAQKLIYIQEQTRKKLEMELDSFFIDSSKKKKAITYLERERDRLREEQIELTQAIQDNNEELREKKVLIFDLKKDAAEAENHIRQQQNLYEAMRSDRNALQKSLQESNAECNELKKKLKILFHQIEQLKEDVGAKEKLLIRDENVMRKMAKEKENLKVDVMNGLNQIRMLKEEVKELREEERSLHKTILEHEKVIKEQTKNLEQLMNERDVLGSQLVRRNDEIALLNDKIVILQATLARGETHYGQRLEDIKLLKLEVKKLRLEKSLMSKSMNSMTDLRQEVFHLERDLTKSRLKCKALEQEVQNPLNVHRWRKLEGSDPDVMDLLQKIQILQKRLLKQGSEAVERERQLKEVERLYLNLRQVLAKQPGPGIQEQMSRMKQELKSRTNKLKCLVSELNMAELKSTEYKAELQKVQEELTEAKKKYIIAKKSNSQIERFESGSLPNIGQNGQSKTEVKIAGGGFRMTVQRSSSQIIEF